MKLATTDWTKKLSEISKNFEASQSAALKFSKLQPQFAKGLDTTGMKYIYDPKKLNEIAKRTSEANS